MPARKGQPKVAGRVKGTPNKATVIAQLELEALRDYVKSRLPGLAEAQADHAQGIGYMVLRQPDGTYARATDVKQVDAALAAGATTFKLYTQAPNTQAFSALLDRTYGRPVEHHEVGGEDGGPIEHVFSWRK